MPGHVAQFYGDDRELAADVGSFLSGGLAAGEAGIVIASAAHLPMLAEGVLADQVLVVDADEMLRGFVTGETIDGARFRASAENLIGQVAGRGEPVRVYAELVALLWDAGQTGLAVELEALWRELAARLPFAGLCGHPARLLTVGEKERPEVRRLCRLHTSVLARPPSIPGRPGASVMRDFPRDVQSARAARQFVLGELASRADDTMRADAAIVIGELAANAVLHAGTPFTVTVSFLPDVMRIAVRDTAPLSDPASLAVRAGHGLDAVAQLAARWAVDPLPDGKAIWADLG
jgi:anti-sigma regulatory factor (Ser/Thr protein kinase)